MFNRHIILVHSGLPQWKKNNCWYWISQKGITVCCLWLWQGSIVSFRLKNSPLDKHAINRPSLGGKSDCYIFWTAFWRIILCSLLLNLYATVCLKKLSWDVTIQTRAATALISVKEFGEMFCRCTLFNNNSNNKKLNIQGFFQELFIHASIIPKMILKSNVSEVFRETANSFQGTTLSIFYTYKDVFLFMIHFIPTSRELE